MEKLTQHLCKHCQNCFLSKDGKPRDICKPCRKNGHLGRTEGCLACQARRAKRLEEVILKYT